MDAYAITSMPIKNMHCIIGVYADLQHIDAHSTYRMSYFEDDATYTFVIPCHPHIQAKTYFSSGCGGCHGLDSFQIRVRRPSHWAELCGARPRWGMLQVYRFPKIKEPPRSSKIGYFPPCCLVISSQQKKKKTMYRFQKFQVRIFDKIFRFGSKNWSLTPSPFNSLM